MFWAFWYHLHNFKNVKHNHRHVLLKYYSSVSVFCIFQNCTSSTKLCKASHINLKQHFLFALSSFGFGKGTIKIGWGRGGHFIWYCYFESVQLLHVGGPYHIETSPWICKANQLTGFYITGTSIMKELTKFWLISQPLTHSSTSHFFKIDGNGEGTGSGNFCYKRGAG